MALGAGQRTLRPMAHFARAIGGAGSPRGRKVTAAAHSEERKRWRCPLRWQARGSGLGRASSNPSLINFDNMRS